MFHINNFSNMNILPASIINSNIPLLLAGIVKDVAQCLESRLRVGHLNVRDVTIQHAEDLEVYRQLIADTPELQVDQDAVLHVTFSGCNDKSFETYNDVINPGEDMKPGMTYLTLALINFIKRMSFIYPQTIRYSASRIQTFNINF